MTGRHRGVPDQVARMIAQAQAQSEGYLEETLKARGWRPPGASGSKEPVSEFIHRYSWKNPADIPKRAFIYGTMLSRKFLTVTVAPGGVGKSSLAIVECLALATGRALLGHRPEGQCRVAYINLEDPMDELERRIQAACQLYGINHEGLGGRLHVSGRETSLKLASQGKFGAILNRPVIEALILQLVTHRIDLLVIDPFVSSHAVPENDNNAMDAVAKAWNEIADRANVAVHLIHHTRKLGPDAEVGTDSARGGKALTDAAREVRVINRMSAEEGAKFGVEQHRQYFKVFSDKANLAPPPEFTDWYKIENIELPNGDHVGVVTKWDAPVVAAEERMPDATDDQILAIQRKIELSNWRADPQADHWAGEAVCDVLGLNGENKTVRREVQKLLKKWTGVGLFKVEKRSNGAGNKVAFLEVAEWVI